MSKLTWNELCKKSEGFKYTTIKGNIIFCCNLGFCKDGRVFAGDLFSGDYNVSDYVSYENMLKIMEALQ